MHPCLEENGIQPALVFCLQEEVISDPEHQLLPGFRATFGVMPLFAIAQEAWAATIQFLRHLGRWRAAAVQCWPSPVRKRFPIDITRNGFPEAVRIDQSETCLSCPLAGNQMCGWVAPPSFSIHQTLDTDPA